MKLTDRAVRNLKPRSTRYERWEGHGFGIRVSPTGRKSWVYVYHYKGHSRRLTLGQYPSMSVAEAHEAYAKALVILERGGDPGTLTVEARTEARHAPTIAELADLYIAKWARPRKRSWREDRRILDKNVLPYIGKRKVADVKRCHIVALLDKLGERGLTTSANRTLAVLRKMFNFLVSRDIVEVSPCLQVPMPSAEQQRDRVLTDDEIRAFWNGLDEAHMTEGVKLALKLVLVTAQRSGEVTQAEWVEVDLEKGWWSLPATKVKNKRAHRVPLSGLAVQLLRHAKLLAGTSQWVFPSPHGDRPVSPSALNRAIARDRDVFNVAHFVPHDLRRTAASHMAASGVPRLVIAKVLNHAESGVTAVYDRHSYDAEKREALDRWARKLVQIMGTEDRMVGTA